MLSPAAWWMVVAPMDLRCGIDKLLAHVQSLSMQALAGAAYVFRNRAGTRLKVVCADGNGVWLCMRRLHRGRFVWPRPGDAVCTLTAEQMAWLCAGVDWQRLSAKSLARSEL
jgi:transposase